MPRRVGISLFYALTMCVGLLYFTTTVQDSKIIATLLVGVSRVFSGKLLIKIKYLVSANCLIGCLETEAFSTEIQSTAIGLI